MFQAVVIAAVVRAATRLHIESVVVVYTATWQCNHYSSEGVYMCLYYGRRAYGV